jgi:hypothetical protein
VVQALQVMKCPAKIFPHQIQGLDYKDIIPVLQWLIDKVRETRDLRAVVNRKQGLLNYSIYNRQMPEKPDVDTARLNALIFERKPKRAFKANRNAGLPFNDPKRVHTALREFNDLSANAVFQNLMS